MVEVKREDLLRFLANGIDSGFNGPPGPQRNNKMAFFLAIMPYDADFTAIPRPEVSYISNVADPRIAEMLKDTFEGFGYHCFLKGTVA